MLDDIIRRDPRMVCGPIVSDAKGKTPEFKSERRLLWLLNQHFDWV